MQTDHFPSMLRVRQRFAAPPPVDIRTTLQRELAHATSGIKPGARIAVAVGSRGITNLQTIVAAVLERLKAAGAQPFIVPAMGSHGGATPEGQTELLAEYGVSEAQLGVPIRAGMEVERLGVTGEGAEIFFSTEALRADGIVVVNRVKPHTDFGGELGSGILKMIVVGLGKRAGAANFHVAASRLGYDRVIRSIARVSLGAAPILCGVAMVENQLHQTVRIAVLLPEDMERREGELLAEAKRLMPTLPFDDLDLLIIDRIGKNISGAGLDPNVIGRGVHGYSSFLGDRSTSPVIRRIFVRDLTPETHGNAIGIGMADFTTTRLVRATNQRVTAINALTALTVQGAKLPIHFDTDREAIEQALCSLALNDTRLAKVARIQDTLSLETLEVSETFAELIRPREDLLVLSGPTAIQFDAADNLAAIT